MIIKPLYSIKKSFQNNRICLNLAILFWTVITIWICAEYSPEKDDNIILFCIGIMGFGTLSIVYYTHVKPYGLEQLIASPQPLNSREKLLFFGLKVKGFIAYQLNSGFAIVTEGPVCNFDFKQVLIEEFEWFCKMRHLKPCYPKASIDELEIFNKLDKKSLQIGKEAIVNVQTFSLDKKENTHLKAAIERMKKSGLQVRTYFPPLKAGLIQQLEKVSDDWLKNTKETQVPFTLQSYHADDIKEHQIISIENNEGKIIAFMNIAPAHNSIEASYHMIRKINEAPDEIFDMLIIKMIEYCKACEYQYLNMGMIPSLKSLDRKIPLFSSQQKPIDFREKFEPQWHSRFLVFDHYYDLFRLPFAFHRLSKYKPAIYLY